MSIKFEGKKYSDFVSGMSEASSPASDDYGTLVGSTKGSRKFKAADIGKSIFSISNGKCVAHLPSLAGGQIVFTYRINSVDGGTTMVQGIAFATFTDTSSQAFKKIDYIQNFNGPFPFVLKNDGTRTAIVYSYGNKNAIDINVLSKDSDWVIDLDGSFPDGWDSSAATDIGTYNLMCQPQWETDFLQNYVDGRIDDGKNTLWLSNNKCVAYFASSGGACVVFSYKFIEQKGSSYYTTSGIAIASVEGTSGNSDSCKIDYINGHNAITAEFPYKIYKSGSTLAIKNVSGHGSEVEIIAHTNTFIPSSDGSFPSGWDSSAETEVGAYYRNATSEDLANSINMYSLGAGKCVAYLPSLSGGSAYIAYRGNKGNSKVDGIAIATFTDTTTAGFRKITFLNTETNGIKPFSMLNDGTRTAIVVNSSFSLSVNVFAKGTWVVSSDGSFPTEWVSSSAFDIGEYEFLKGSSSSSSKFGEFAKFANAITCIHKSSNTSKNFGLCIVTDSHNDDVSVSNAVTATKELGAIDALIHCGDYVSDTIDINDLRSTFASVVSGSSKPVYFVMGNHEKGNYFNIRYTPNDTQLYNLFIKPIVDKGWLKSGEYTENKCYYYHDFSSTSTRLIVIDEYEAPMDFNNSYWQQITYNSSYANISDSTAYAVGDCVNVPGYTDYSFACTTACTPTSYASGKHPRYKCRRGRRYISQTQAQWFLDTLADAPSGYNVIVALHNPFSDIATTQNEKKFCQNDFVKTGADCAQNLMETDFIADAINAFTNRANFLETVKTKSYEEGNYISSYSVSKDFSSASGNFCCMIGGHVHRDLIFKHPTYTNQYQITPMCSNTTYWGQAEGADIRLDNDSSTDDGVDSLTCISFAENRIALCKIGNNVSDDGYIRDIEVWNPNA